MPELPIFDRFAGLGLGVRGLRLTRINSPSSVPACDTSFVSMTLLQIVVIRKLVYVLGMTWAC